MCIESVKALNEDCDDDGQREHDEDVRQGKGMGEERMPAGVRMRSSNDALSEDEVDDKEQDHARRYEDLSRHGNSNLGWPGRPYDSHHAGGNARHAEAEHHAGHDEFMTSPHVQLQYRHVSDGAEDKEEEEDGRDGDIKTDGRNAAEGGRGRRVRWTWRLRWSLRAVSHLCHDTPDFPWIRISPTYLSRNQRDVHFHWDYWWKHWILLIKVESCVSKKNSIENNGGRTADP